MAKRQISASEPRYDYFWGDNFIVAPVHVGVISSETWRRDLKRFGFLIGSL